MANYYLDFVGLNTFIYEVSRWDDDIFNSGIEQYNSVEYSTNPAGGSVFRAGELNTIGWSDNFFNNASSKNLAWSKNYLFSHNLPTTASFFPALMIKRNGPYGYNSFKQIRVSENPLSRRQRKENIFTFVREPGDEIIMNNSGKLSSLRGKYGPIKKFTEVAVTSRYKPFTVGASTALSNGDLERFELLASYGNETNYFNNNELNNYYNKRDKKSRQYEKVSGFYLNKGLESDLSPIDVFEFFKYKECIYPPRIYQFKSYVRQRTAFSFPWRDNRDDRTFENSSPGFFISGGSTPVLRQSKWPLDPYEEFETVNSSVSAFFYWQHMGGMDGTAPHQLLGSGILQNRYTFGTHQFDTKTGKLTIEKVAGVGPLYNRFHTIFNSSSVVSPNGMKINGINFGGYSDGDLDNSNTPCGEASWDAGKQSGLNPFYDSYDKYVDGIRQYGKDYTIIPEFRINDFVSRFQTSGLVLPVENLLSLSGASAAVNDSSDQKFYEIYSTSDFMKHFEIVKKDHKEFVDPMSITLRCKALKKFLPYEGFYPAQRSVHLAQQFYDSYKGVTSLNTLSGSTTFFAGVEAGAGKTLFQNLMTPMFAPGIFFNTIKSGVAVDYPLMDQNLALHSGNVKQITSSPSSYGGSWFLQNYTASSNRNVLDFFDRRVPFEAIVEPEKYLVGERFYCNEPHPNANNSGSAVVEGFGNKLYKLMAHNFLAETNNFFMKNDRYTTISSKPSSDPTVGLAEAGTIYAMRVKMFKSQDSPTLPQESSSAGGYFTVPQYDSSSRETFTMYSRPTAFGPPQFIEQNIFLPSTGTLGSVGENYAFTPPYYYGQAWADISFVANESKKYSLSEIIASSSVFQTRYVSHTSGGLLKTYYINGVHYDWGHVIDSNAGKDHQRKKIGMQLDSSVNLFSQNIDSENSVDPNNPTTRWTIQTKFETPMLNFNHLGTDSSVTLSNNAFQAVPRGMWHQYGLIEEDPAKGVFLQVTDVPKPYVEFAMTETPNHESLAELCGFSSEPTRLGEIADSKTVFEAVVAIPFIEKNGERFFFRLKRKDVENAFGSAADRSLVGNTVIDMIVKMQKYVFPPQIDFINNSAIDPFAMYIFEFKHTFDKQDLANMWQNLYPEIGQTFETAESVISHQLLAHELLGGGAVMNDSGLLDTNAIGNEIPDRVRWMVFKVKQRAKINYFEKIYGREDALSDAVVTSQGEKVQVSYNWPYDFFSLVELAKIESEVKFAKRLENPNRQPVNESVPIPREDLPEPSSNRLFEEAIAGELPTPNDIPRPLADGGSDYISPQLQGSLGRAAKAGMLDAFLQGQMEMNRLTPNQGGVNNPYGNTPLGRIYLDIISGLGQAGRVGLPQHDLPYSVQNQAAGSNNQNAELVTTETLELFDAGPSMVNSTLFGFTFRGYN